MPPLPTPPADNRRALGRCNGFPANQQAAPGRLGSPEPPPALRPLHGRRTTPQTYPSCPSPNGKARDVQLRRPVPHRNTAPTGTPDPGPWALRRIAPYPPFEEHPYARVELDAATQTARYLDATGAVVMAPGHGTSSGTNPPTGTTGQGDRQGDAPDSDTGNDTDQ
ncbi:putative ATP-grasp-modified RiPP [Streptomyces sp. NPDC003077]|uniref:putative ATP-grasp-modified RiPP n=1 Tax=Streptomyces sp. NPDC003077 TaxID=3154443 RepID=UPI0033A18CB9